MKVAMLVLNDMTADARVDREAAALTEAGHEVVVMALRSHGLPDEESCSSGVVVRRVADYTTAGWRRPWAKASQSRSRTDALAAAAGAMAPDVIHAHDADTLMAADRARAATGAKLVYDAHELYSDMISEFGLGGSFPVQSYWRRIERTLIPRSDAVITVSDGLADVLADRHGVQVTVVRNVPAIAPLVETDRLRTELGLPTSAPIVLYQGVLIPGRALVPMVRAMSTVHDAHLVIQGFGPEEPHMREVSVAMGLSDRVHFMGKIPAAQLHEYACGADIGVVTYEATTLNNRMAAPNKLWAYRMAGLPVVASDFPGLRHAVLSDGVGRVFDPVVEDSLGNAIRGLLSDPGALRAMAARSRKLAEERDNWDIEKQKLLDVYDRLAAASTS